MVLRFEIRVQGRLSRRLIDEFEELDLVASVEPVRTVLQGPVEDQAALHGLLRLIAARGLDVVDVRRSAAMELAGQDALAGDGGADHVPGS